MGSQLPIAKPIEFKSLVATIRRVADTGIGRRKRWKTLFQLPNAGGRSHQGAPARAIQSHCIDKQTVVLAVPAFVAFLTWNKPLDAQPLRIRQFSPNQDRPPQLRS
jgi:hypothetical protein